VLRILLLDHKCGIIDSPFPFLNISPSQQVSDYLVGRSCGRCCSSPCGACSEPCRCRGVFIRGLSHRKSTSNRQPGIYCLAVVYGNIIGSATIHFLLGQAVSLLSRVPQWSSFLLVSRHRQQTATGAGDKDEKQVVHSV
jgi:hypothetical protein